MATYLILNLIFIALAMTLLRIKPKRPSRIWLVTFSSLLVLTFMFDSLMIYFDFFHYAPDKILGIHIGLAPIEDFFYPLLACIIVPAVWYKLEKR